MPLNSSQLVGLIELEEGVSLQDAWEDSPFWSNCPSLAGRYPQATADFSAFSAEEPPHQVAADMLQLRCDLESAYSEILATLGR